MPTSYKQVYGMLKVTTWVGDPKPDSPQTSFLGEEELFSSEEVKGDLNPLNSSSEELSSNLTFEKESSNFFPDPETGPLTSDATKVGYLGYGLNVQAALYKDPALLNVLRLYSIGEINRKFPNTQFISAGNYKEGESLGAFRKASITIKAVGENVYPLFGKIHSTTILISSCAILSEISTFLSKNSFKVGPDNIPYKIVPNSVRVITTKISSSAIC